MICMLVFGAPDKLLHGEVEGYFKAVRFSPFRRVTSGLSARARLFPLVPGNTGQGGYHRFLKVPRVSSAAAARKNYVT
jgi:hypothetical protein